MKLYKFRTLEPLRNGILRHAVPSNELNIIFLVSNKTVLIISSPYLAIKGFSRVVLILPLQIFDIFFLGFFLILSIFLNFLAISLEQYFGRLLQMLVPYLLAVVAFFFQMKVAETFLWSECLEKICRAPMWGLVFLGISLQQCFLGKLFN